ncbi:hypothetical protein AOLI_G00309740 [Acnodon oligacanthus]
MLKKLYLRCGSRCVTGHGTEGITVTALVHRGPPLQHQNRKSANQGRCPALLYLQPAALLEIQNIHHFSQIVSRSDGALGDKTVFSVMFE